MGKNIDYIDKELTERGGILLRRFILVTNLLKRDGKLAHAEIFTSGHFNWVIRVTMPCPISPSDATYVHIEEGLFLASLAQINAYLEGRFGPFNF